MEASVLYKGMLDTAEEVPTAVQQRILQTIKTLSVASSAREELLEGLLGLENLLPQIDGEISRMKDAVAVKAWVSAPHRTEKEIADKVAKETRVKVLRSILESPSAPISALETTVKRSRSADILYLVVSHNRTPKDLKEEAAIKALFSIAARGNKEYTKEDEIQRIFSNFDAEELPVLAAKANADLVDFLVFQRQSAAAAGVDFKVVKRISDRAMQTIEACYKTFVNAGGSLSQGISSYYAAEHRAFKVLGETLRRVSTVVTGCDFASGMPVADVKRLSEDLQNIENLLRPLVAGAGYYGRSIGEVVSTVHSLNARLREVDLFDTSALEDVATLADLEAIVKSVVNSPVTPHPLADAIVMHPLATAELYNELANSEKSNSLKDSTSLTALLTAGRTEYAAKAAILAQRGGNFSAFSSVLRFAASVEADRNTLERLLATFEEEGEHVMRDIVILNANAATVEDRMGLSVETFTNALTGTSVYIRGLGYHSFSPNQVRSVMSTLLELLGGDDETTWAMFETLCEGDTSISLREAAELAGLL